ncbi:MAG: sensor histidine kinase, partial [Dehalococcoidales bacterium]|nr:sensor histidine kinase [Dehalococcoidales bacterium]
DGTIQSLVLLCRRLDSMHDKGELLPSSVTDRLQEARVTAEEAVRELRDVTKALRPPILDDLGMVTSIRRLLDDFVERTGAKGQQKVVGQQRRLPSDTELGIFRIAQEALRNVERHAKATRVTVTITFAHQEVGLEVADNGVGFSVSSVLGDLITSGQHGLLSMRERAELLGGKFEIQSSFVEGTWVMVSIPVAGDISQSPPTPTDR